METLSLTNETSAAIRVTANSAVKADDNTLAIGSGGFVTIFCHAADWTGTSVAVEASGDGTNGWHAVLDESDAAVTFSSDGSHNFRLAGGYLRFVATGLAVTVIGHD